MVDPQASRFWHAALQSGLIDKTGLEACWQAVPPEKRTPDAIDRRLARQAVNAGYLTLWQAQQILKGRSIGFRIDKYLLLDHIGQGGMGRVYLAKDTRLNRRVALKVLSPERMNNPRALARFLREAKVGAQLQHENLVRIYDEGECNGVRYLVMEYIEGKTAGNLITQQGPMPPATAARLTRQVALGLEHAHQKGLIHRDVNPWNILITREGTAKLTDLGLAIDLADHEDAVTRDGATVGTFDYISPEQARHSRSVDTRSDIYSLGCTLYHLLAGKVPFPMPSLPEKLYAHQLQQPEPLTNVVPGLPEGLDAVVQKMMRKVPEERYPDPGAVARALEPYIGGAAGATLSSPSREVLAPTVSAGSGLLTPPSPSPDKSSSSSPGAADSQLSPAPTVAAGSDTDLQDLLTIDLGPAPPLAEPRPGSKSKTSSTDGIDPRHLQIGAGVAAAIVLLLAIGVALRGTGAGGSATKPRGVLSSQDKKSRGSEGTATKPQPSDSVAATEEPEPISVLWPDGYRKPFNSGDAFIDLRDAIQNAGEKGAIVVLRNRKPLVIKSKQQITCPGGSVEIRAGRGEQPVLFVELAGKQPFLLAKSDTTLLKVQGLTIQVSYADAKSTPPPLIEAGGNLELDSNCFTATGAAGGNRAIKADGQNTIANGCFFEGFERPLEQVMVAGTRVKLSHCMMVGPKKGEPPGSWALALRHGGGGGGRANRNKDRIVELDHCTISTTGLLAAEGFSPESPLTVELNDSAVHAEALVLWMSKNHEFAKALQWSGQRNRYDLGGAAWVLKPPSTPAGILDGVPDGPANLEGWSKTFTGENGAESGSIEFAGSTSAPPHEPRDFALAGQTSSTIGADPAKVGPRPGSSSKP